MTVRKVRSAARQRRQNTTKFLFLAGGLLLVIAVVISFSKKSPSQATGPVKVGKQMRDFSLKDINGKTVRLQDFAGQVVLVNAWATWCPPCKAEMPDLNAYYQTHQSEGFMILAVNAGDPAEDAAAFANQKGLAFPVLLDPRTNLINSLGIYSFPTSILVGRDGLVKAIHVGMFTPQVLEAEITPYLSR
jgi:peroxiredoxin